MGLTYASVYLINLFNRQSMEIDAFASDASEGRPSFYRTAMVGEITLTGEIFSIGGVREKFIEKQHMKPSQALKRHRADVRGNTRVFGSVLHGRDGEGSDLDLLIDPKGHMTLFDIGAISYELGELLGVEVDVLTPNALPDSFREKVLSEAVPV